MLRAALSLATAFVVELSQLYHAPWIDSIRQTTLGGLVLGFGFLWTDLLCYSVGIAIESLQNGVFTARRRVKRRRLGSSKTRHDQGVASSSMYMTRPESASVVNSVGRSSSAPKQIFNRLPRNS